MQITAIREENMRLPGLQEGGYDLRGTCTGGTKYIDHMHDLTRDGDHILVHFTRRYEVYWIP